MNNAEIGKEVRPYVPPLAPPPYDEVLDAHRSMVIWLFLTTVVTCLMLAATLWETDRVLAVGYAHTPMLFVVVIAGALGGFVSRLHRLYAFEDALGRSHALLFRRLNWYLVTYSTIPPIVGVIAAAMLYGVFAGELIRGPLFPNFDCLAAGNGCKTLTDVMSYWAPVQPTDYAKCVVWGFVAGFAERYMDDILGRIGARGEAV